LSTSTRGRRGLSVYQRAVYQRERTMVMYDHGGTVTVQCDRVRRRGHVRAGPTSPQRPQTTPRPLPHTSPPPPSLAALIYIHSLTRSLHLLETKHPLSSRPNPYARRHTVHPRHVGRHSKCAPPQKSHRSTSHASCTARRRSGNHLCQEGMLLYI
jgi:hypothetical protein